MSSIESPEAPRQSNVVTYMFFLQDDFLISEADIRDRFEPFPRTQAKGVEFTDTDGVRRTIIFEESLPVDTNDGPITEEENEKFRKILNHSRLIHSVKPPAGWLIGSSIDSESLLGTYSDNISRLSATSPPAQT